MKPPSSQELLPPTLAPLRRPARPHRRALWIVAAVATLAIVLWGAFRFFGNRDKAPPPPTPVQATLATAERQDFAVYIAGVGTVLPNQSVTVKARVDGQLQTLGYREGQDVRAGQLIAQIDPRPFQAQLAQVVAQKGRDAAQLANARLDLKRYEDLMRDEATSQQAFDTQKALVAQLEATVRTDEAQVTYAKTQLDYTTITAPITGRTGLRLVDVGNIVHSADTGGLVVIDQIDPITVVFTVPDASFQQVNAAMRAKAGPLVVVAYARDDDKPLATGRLVLVDNHIDTTSGTVQVKAAFANPTHALWPGQYVNARLFVETRPRAIVVPAAAVQRSQRGTYAYVVDGDDRAQLQPIHVALVQDGQAVIDQGLDEGQRVVTDGQYKVKPGVTIASASSGASDAPASSSNPVDSPGATGAAGSGNRK